MLTRTTDKLNDLIWSPSKEDEFIAFDFDIYLYKVVNSKASDKENHIRLCDETTAELIASYTDNSSPRVVAWHLGQENPNLLAVNFSNHKIQLINKKPNANKFETLKEFSFKQIRQCNNLAWNPYQKYTLAAGFERIRTEHSILVWDVRDSANSSATKFDLSLDSIATPSIHTSHSESNGFNNKISAFSSLTMSINIGSTPSIYQNSEPKKVDSIKSIYETGTSETCNSLSWNPHNENILLAGVNSKSLKIFDIRANTKAGQSVNTKYTHSFSLDCGPNAAPYQASSYCENVVAIWDIRMFEKPIHTIVENNTIQKIQWCPTRSGKLAVLGRASNTMNIYTVKSINNSFNVSVIEDENAPVQLIIDKITKKCPSPINIESSSNTKKQVERTNSTTSTNTLVSTSSQIMNGSSFINGANGQMLTNFSWYSFDTNKLLVSSNFLLSNIRTLCLSDAIVASWSPNGDFCWSSSLGRINVIENLDKNEFEFTASFKDRVKSDYGLKYEIITISNGSATSTSSNSSLYNPQSPLPSTNSLAIPLSLALNASNGLNTLIRADFYSNIKTTEFKNTSSEVTVNIKYLWEWFESVNRLFEKTIPLNPRNTQIELPASSRSCLIELYWTRYCGLKALLNDFIAKKPYNLDPAHEERFRVIAYNLCLWNYKDGAVSREFFANLENMKQFERASCLALLTDNHEQSLEILENASKHDNRFGCLWIALKYFYDEQKQRESKKPTLQHQTSITSLSHSFSIKSPSSPSILGQNSLSLSSNKSPFFMGNTSLESTPTHKQPLAAQNSVNSILSNSMGDHNDLIFKECNKLIENFNNPYLKAMFNYMINKEEAIMKILGDRNILFQDRIALSVYFMYHPNKQAQLQQYFDSLIEDECLKHADLHGVLLTGLGPKCIDLFQSFIDKTNDIQTVSLAVIHTPFSDVIHSKTVQCWINNYREMLNRFKFWEKRAEFDVFRMKLLKSQNLVNSNASQSMTETNFLSADSNMSSSSSSSITSSNLGNVTPTPSKVNQHNQNPIFFLNQSSAILNQLTTNASRFNLNAQLMNPKNLLNNFSSNSLFNQPNSNQICVNYNCNKCGKNLLQARNYLTTQLSSNLGSNFSLQHIQSSLSLNQQISSKAASTNNLNKMNEISLNGCLNCAHFLPQCSVCLRLMKINLYPNPNTNQNILITLNRSQSSYIQTNKLQLNYANNKTKIPYSISPNGVQSEQLTAKNKVDLSLDIEEESMPSSKSIFQYKSVMFLNNNKYGNWFSWCQNCKHGGHIKHLIEWFKCHDKCPFIHCNCECTNIDFFNK